MVHLDKTLQQHKHLYALPKHVADDLSSTALLSFSVQYELFKHFKEEKLPLFGLTSKAHSLVHCCMQSEYRERTDMATYIFYQKILKSLRGIKVFKGKISLKSLQDLKRNDLIRRRGQQIRNN